jgi:hypothetical protein
VRDIQRVAVWGGASCLIHGNMDCTGELDGGDREYTQNFDMIYDMI